MIREKDMRHFRFAEDGIFDACGNVINRCDLDQKTFYGFDGASLEKIENRRIYVDYKDIPENAKRVFLIMEDTRFYRHIGVDFIGILRAFKNNITGGGMQGGSTLTMQLVKMLFLRGYSRTVKYKLIQIYLALLMERYYTKNQIMELYINTIFFGNNTYGMAAASKLYFNKPLKDISLSESIWLRVIAQRPGQRNPYKNAEWIEERRKQCVRGYHKTKKIGDEEFNQLLLDVPVVVPMQKGTGGKEFTEIYTVMFCDNTSAFAPEIGYVYDRLAAAGFTDSVIAGIMGNIHVESGFNPQCVNFLARGLCQWNGERVERLMESFPDSYMQIESQMDFLLSEFDEAGLNADPGAAAFHRLAQEKPERTASYYSDLFQALVERNLHQDHYDDVMTVSNPSGKYTVYNRLSRVPNEYDGLYYLDATRRRNYAEIYLKCIQQKQTVSMRSDTHFP